MRKNLFFTIALLMAQFTAAQAQDYSKMSFQLQKFLGERQQKVAKSAASADNKYVMMLVQGDDDALRPYSISHQGDIHIVRVPVGKIAELSEDSRVRRMEADFRVPTTCLDQARVKVGGDLANSGFNLPQAFDGTGVMVGNADCAFELTHPTFRSAKDGHLRIVRFWDLLDFSKSQVWNEESRFPCGVLLTDTTDIINKLYPVLINTNRTMFTSNLFQIVREYILSFSIHILPDPLFILLIGILAANQHFPSITIIITVN